MSSTITGRLTIVHIYFPIRGHSFLPCDHDISLPRCLQGKQNSQVSKYKDVKFSEEQKVYVTCHDFIGGLLSDDFKLYNALPTMSVYDKMIPIKKKKLEDLAKTVHYVSDDCNDFYSKMLLWPTSHPYQIYVTFKQVLSKMAQLLSIQADRNRLTKPYLPPMNYLQVLTLNSNKILSTQGIAHPILECLELNHNHIHNVHDLHPEDLPRLRVIELRGNSLSSTLGIRLGMLESLYLASNSLERLEGLEQLVNLKTLHLRENPLTTLDGFSRSMKALRYVNIRGCQLESAQETMKLAVLPALEVLVVLGNPFAQQEDEEEEEDRYRLEVLTFLPRLKRLDKTAVGEEELEKTKEMRAEMEKSELQEDEDMP
ncbi:hypothetical protein PR048_009031 [Dryococelus australis]|uniref:Leucine-rich repeat-containing protein 23 n=1 Tax=Dryococelus australis TaxID=614101 RepID=A0ABQ9HYR4_9NEOP|nr:hypothetical protein PR048_009031 [Dryococelus australis]